METRTKFFQQKRYINYDVLDKSIRSEDIRDLQIIFVF